ncbi:hypothetical protein QUT03_22665, partial [Xanthomonas citri pv. citri]
LLLAGSGAALQPADPTPESAFPESLELAQVTIRERVIIRVQTLAPRLAPAPRKIKPIKWKERKAKRCVAVSTLATASVNDRNSVDLVLRSGDRLRAKLESDCPALDFYSGFYLKPNPDGKICADRDMIFSRSGGQCEITAFRSLVPER